MQPRNGKENIDGDMLPFTVLRYVRAYGIQLLLSFWVRSFHSFLDFHWTTHWCYRFLVRLFRFWWKKREEITTMLTTSNVKNKWMGFEWQNQIRAMCTSLTISGPDDLCVCACTSFCCCSSLWMTISNRITHIHRKGLFDLSFILCSNVLQICLCLLNDVCMLCTPYSLFIFISRNRCCICCRRIWRKQQRSSFVSSFAVRVIKYAFCRLFAERGREVERVCVCTIHFDTF